MRKIKISEEQDRLIREMIAEDVNEMLNPNAGAGNTAKTELMVTPTQGGKPMDMTRALDMTKTITNTTNADSVSTTGKIGDKTGRFVVDKNQNANGSVYESILLDKSQVRKMQLMKLKENSTVIKKKNISL